MTYTTKDIQRLFGGVSHTTVQNWCDETDGFGAFLSPSARPEQGHKRQFTDDDLRVFALVHEMKQGKATNEQIRIALAMEERGSLPEHVDVALIPANHLVQTLTDLRQEVQVLRTTIQQLEAEKQQQGGQITLLKEQLAEAQQEIRKLLLDNARLHDD